MSNAWSLVRTVDPTQEPLSVPQAMANSRIDQDEENIWIREAIQEARVHCETFLCRQLMSATYLLTLDFFPGWTIKLPLPPLQSVTSIKYLDTSGTQVTLASTEYLVDARSTPGRITPAYNKVWPLCRLQMAAVEITFVCGQASADSIPFSIRRALKLLTSHFYEHREETTEMKLASIPMGAMTLLEGERSLDFSGPLGGSSSIPGSVAAWGGSAWWT